MAVSLSKGGNISLAKSDSGPQALIVGLGWNPRTTDGAMFDLDASAILCTDQGKVRSDEDFVFYNRLGDKVLADGKTADTATASVMHLGDNRDGQGDGDDEQVAIDLTRVPADVAKIAFVVSIDQADTRGQNFGQVSGAYIRVLDGDTNQVIESDGKKAQYDLAEDAAGETALIFGEVYRHDGGWKFRAVGQGFSSGLAGVIKEFGLDAN